MLYACALLRMRERELASQTRIAHGTQHTYVRTCTHKFIPVRAMMLSSSESETESTQIPSRSCPSEGGVDRPVDARSIKAMICVRTQCKQFSWPVNAKRSIQGASLCNSSLIEEGTAAGFIHALRNFLECWWFDSV
jgi:hypothetical protein